MKTATCASCGREFEAQRSTAQFCGPTCRSRSHRAPDVDETPDDGAETPFEASTRREVERLNMQDTHLGQQVLIIARRMAQPETGAALVSLSKEHSRLMSAMGSTTSEARPADPVDEVRSARERKRAEARTASR